MPSLEVHCYIDGCFIGRAYPRLHKALDAPFLILGRYHRVLFHDYGTAVYIARREYPGDPNAERAAILHIEFDRMCSADLEYKILLQEVVQETAKQRKRIKKQIARLKKTIKKLETPQKKRMKSRQKKLKAEWDRIVNSWKIKKRRKKRRVS
jgi:hypothetical protein